MRNLRQYPITEDEVNRELYNIQVPHTENSPIGGTGPMIRHAFQIFFSDKENMSKLLDQMKV